MACIAAGAEAPDFILHTDRGDAWRLSAHRGAPLILMFHRHLQ
jgi:peroxiredoxin